MRPGKTQAAREIRVTLRSPAPRLGLTFLTWSPKCIGFVAPPELPGSMCHPPTQEKPVMHFNVGEVVERRELSSTTRGTVVHVTADGSAVTVQWYGWLGLVGSESMHHSDELVRVAD
jgi:hypothetical protein